jgi:hypothetical protein
MKKDMGGRRVKIEFTHAMNRSWQRCEHIALNELIYGYTPTHNLYMQMSEEIRGLANWILQYEAELNQDAIQESDF